MPVMEFFDIPATARASFACYSRESDIDALVAALAKAREVFSLMDLKDLYRDVILDHNKTPRLFGRLDPADSAADGHNPAVRRSPARHAAARRRSRRPTCGSTARVARSRWRPRRSCAKPSRANSAPRSRTCSSEMHAGAHASRRAGPGRSRQARRAVGRARISGAREMREPVLAHAECRARSQSPSRSRPNRR